MQGVNLARLRSARRLCLFAQYHQDAIVADHVVRYLCALVDAGFTVLVLSTSSLSEGECAKVRATGAELVLRANHGMDFGGWIEACRALFPIQAELLLLANDSVYAPLGDLPAFVDGLTGVDADFYGALETFEIAPHLQSWFVLLRPSAYRSDAFAALMLQPMIPTHSKLELVTHYEVGLTQALAQAGYRYHAAFTLADRGGIARAVPYNPAHLLWREMIKSGVPFLKVELLRLNRMRVSDTARWRAVVEAHAPDMVTAIEADLAQRGTVPPPGQLAISRDRDVYWPEVRGIVLADYCTGGRHAARYLKLFRVVTTLTRGPRWVAARAFGVLLRLRG